MSTNTLATRSSGETITESFFNDFNSALEGDFVGRNSSGVATSGQNLGTAAITWGTINATGLVINGSSVDVSQVSAPKYRIVSGKVRSTSNQPAFITPNGSAASLIVAGATTNLLYDVNGSAYTLAADLTKSSLTTAASTQNTALVNDTDAADGETTRTWGEKDAEKAEITIDTIGTNITAEDGKYAAFKINDGTNDEYFLALVDTTNNKLKDIKRGYFYDSSLNPVNRIKFADGDTITLMSLGYVFLDSDLTTVDVTYNEPVYAFTAATSPATGDYWMDLGNTLWKRYDGASFVTVTREFIGWAVIDSTNCVAARCKHFDAVFKKDNGITLVKDTSAIIKTVDSNQSVSVAGKRIEFNATIPDWNITTDLAAAVDMYASTEQASTKYYIYLKDTGDTTICDISPYYRSDMGNAYYHPHNPWRCVGQIQNDSSSNFEESEDLSKYNIFSKVVAHYHTTNGFGSGSTTIRKWTTSLENNSGSGKPITVSNDTTLGLTVTANRPIEVVMEYADIFNAARAHGISLNSTELTSAYHSITAADKKVVYETSGNTNVGTCTLKTGLKKGGVLRCHSDSAGDAASNKDRAFVRVETFEPI